MAAPLTEQGGIARVFAEFSLLPDLLARCQAGEQLDGLPPLWAGFLEEAGCNLDHVEENDCPNDWSVWRWMAEDALSLSLRLYLLGEHPAGNCVVLTPGQEAASMADAPMDERGEAEDRQLRSLLAQQVQAYYQGTYVLLEKAARAMQRTEHVWAKHCPGLLLVEFDALFHEADNDRARAERLIGQLEMNRDFAMRSYERPGPTSGPEDNAVLHADAVTDFYLFGLEYGDRSSLTITGARASAMLFTFAGLLAEGSPLGPVQFLIPPPS